MSNRFFKFWFPVIIYSGIIFGMSSIPRLDISIRLPFIDKLLHMVAYGILGLLFFRAFYATAGQRPKIEIVIYTLLFCFMHGIGDEYHQAFVPGRMATFADVIADHVRVFLGTVLHVDC